MSNVIGFLQTMGEDASLRHASQDDVALALTESGIDPILHAAILNEDTARLGLLLEAPAIVFCGLEKAPAEDEEEEEEDKPSREDEEIRMRLLQIA